MENTFEQSADAQKIFQSMDYYARYPNFRLFTGKKVYELHEQVRKFLQTKAANTEEQQNFHGNFVWKLKKYYGTSFQKEAVALINANIKELNLSDKDKLGYFNYLLSTKVYSRFHNSFFQKLADVDFAKKENKLQAQHIFHKMKTILAQKRKKKSEYADLFQKFEPFMQNSAEKSGLVSYKMLGDYAEVYFDAAMQCEYKEVSMQPLLSLMQRTTAMQAQQMPQLFENQDAKAKPSRSIDKKAAYQLLKAYHDFSLQHEKQLRSNLNFHHAVTSMFCDMVQNFDYTANDVKNLRKALGSRHGGGSMQARLYESGLIIQRAYNQSHSRGVSVRNRTVQIALKNGGRWD